MKTRILYLAIASFAIFACSPKVLTSISVQKEPLPEGAEVALLNENEPAPTDGEKLGTVKVGDSGFTTLRNATYEIVTNIAKDRAREAGGNLVKVTEHRAPDFVSSIHRINADIYSVSDIAAYLPRIVADTTFSVSEVNANTYAANHSEGTGVSEQEVQDKISARYGYRISIYGGWARRLAKIPGGQDAVITEYLKDLRNGYAIGGDFTWFFSNNSYGYSHGLGFKYNDFIYSNSLYGTFVYSDNTQRTGTMSSNINLFFYGPMYAFRKMRDDKKGIFWFNVGLGLTSYVEKFDSPKQNLLSTSAGLSEFLDLGYDLRIAKKLYLGAAGSLYTGSLATMTVKDKQSGEKQTIILEPDQYESLNQLSLTVGLKYNF